MKKTVLALIMSLIIVCSLALSVYASNTVSYTIESATTSRGETVELKVTASNATDVGSIMFVISYDSNVLTPVSGTWSQTITGKNPPMAENWEDTNCMFDPIAAFNNGVEINGHIFTLKFKVNDNAAFGATTVNIEVFAQNGAENELPSSVQKGIVKVECPHANTESRVEIPAKCNQPGTAAGVYCLDCNTYKTGGTEIPATGLHADADNKWETDGDKHWHTCSCGQILDEAAHTGGTATCVAKAKCSICEAEYGSINADNHKKGELQKDADYHWYVCDNGCGNPIEKVAHADSTKQVATEVYLKNPEATCTQKLEYYYACTVCEAKTTATWTSETKGAIHTYDTYNDAKPEVHEKDKLEAAVAAHYICACEKIFDANKSEVANVDALKGAVPKHDELGKYKKDSEKHCKTCSVCGFEHTAENHTFTSAEDMICDVCEYDRSCQHTDGFTYVAAVAPTCTEKGTKEYWKCNKCSAKFAENSASSTPLDDVTGDKELGHAPADTYTTDEASHWKVCTRENCGIVLEDTKAKHDGEATCVAKAKCSACKKEYGEINKDNHKSGALENDADKHWNKCDNGCGTHLNEAVHTGGTATCVAKAVCSVCEKEYGEINKDNHKSGALENDADKHWNKCDNGCGTHLNEAVHTGGTATCDDKPVCSTCNVEYGVALGHAFSNTLEAKGAEGHGYKCTNGCGEYKDFADHDNTGEICEDCGYRYHTCGVDTVTFVPAVPGTCIKKGYAAYYKCTDAKCGKLYYDAAATSIINSLTEIESYGAHNTSFIPAVPATCTTNGATESMTCWTCGMKFMTSTVIPATGHNFGEWTTTLEPTDFVAGSKSRTCSNCNEVETEVIPALDHEHTAVEIPAVAPTCTETGLTAGSKCSTCEAIIVAQETVAVLEHIVEHVAAKAATATEVGNVEYWYCTACEVVWLDEQRTTTATKEDVVIPATGEIVIETPAEEGEESSVIIAGTGIAVGTKVEVTYKPAEEFANVSVTVEGKQGSILQVADITLELEGNKVQPDGSVQVKLLINEALRTLENLEVVYIAADGTVEVMNAVREGNYLVFDAKHFSNYAVVELKEEVVTEPEETTQAPEETTAAPEETTAAPEETTAAPEETTAAPEETTQAPDDITVPEETTEAPVETTEAPEETTAAPEETTSPEVPSTGDNAIFFIVALIAFSAIFAVVVTISKKRNDN